MGMGLLRLLAILIAAGTALTNSVTETVLASTTLTANSAQPYKKYRIRGQVRATATNSTDTLRVRIRIGPTTLTGTVVADSTAVDVANDDAFAFDLEFTPRLVTQAATSTATVTGLATIAGAEGTATARIAWESLSSVNFTVDQKIEITGVWSVANAGNSCQAEHFTVEEVG